MANQHFKSLSNSGYRKNKKSFKDTNSGYKKKLSKFNWYCIIFFNFIWVSLASMKKNVNLTILIKKKNKHSF